MKQFTVTIETSVLVTSDDLYDDEDELTPELAKKIALGWLEESVENSNPVVRVSLDPPRMPCQDCGIPIPDPGEHNKEPEALLCDKCATKDRFRMTYEHCGETWQDDYSCACNSECPVCHEKDIEPTKVEDL